MSMTPRITDTGPRAHRIDQETVRSGLGAQYDYQRMITAYGEKGAATRLGISVAKLRSVLKSQEPRKPIPHKGPRGRAWDAFRAEYLMDCMETDRACCLCGSPITMRSQLAHLVPRDLAPDLVCVAENVRPICRRHPQPETGLSGQALVDCLRRYGDAAAEYTERELRKRGLVKEHGRSVFAEDGA